MITYRRRPWFAEAMRRLHGASPHAKVTMWGVVVIVVLVTTIHAASRAIAPPKATPQPLAQRLDDALSDAHAAAPKSDMRVIKITKEAELESRVVKTERIFQPLPALQEVQKAQEVQTEPEPVPPVAAPISPRRRYAAAALSVERNICTRHNMRKEITRGGKSWRCRR